MASFFDLMQCVCFRLEADEIQFFCCIAYFVWEQQNKVIFGSLHYNPSAIVLRAKTLHMDYQAASHLHHTEAQVRPMVRDVLVVHNSWNPPLEGWYKLNWAIHKSSASCLWSVGFLVWDHKGRVLVALVLELTDLPRGVHPYVGAVIQGLRFSLSMRFLDVVMEGPPVHFMSATASVKLENTIEDFWVEDIWFLCQQHRR